MWNRESWNKQTHQLVAKSWVRAQGCNGKTGRTPSGLLLPLKGFYKSVGFLNLEIYKSLASGAVETLNSQYVPVGLSLLFGGPPVSVPLLRQGRSGLKGLCLSGFQQCGWMDQLFSLAFLCHVQDWAPFQTRLLAPQCLADLQGTRGKRGWVRRFAGPGLLPCAASQGNKAPKGALAPSQRLARFLPSPLNVKLLFIHLFILALELPSPHVAVAGWHKDPVRLCPVPRGHAAAL